MQKISTEVGSNSFENVWVNIHVDDTDRDINERTRERHGGSFSE